MKLSEHHAELATAVHLGRIPTKAFMPGTPANALDGQLSWPTETISVFHPPDRRRDKGAKGSTNCPRPPERLACCASISGSWQNDLHFSPSSRLEIATASRSQQ